MLTEGKLKTNVKIATVNSRRPPIHPPDVPKRPIVRRCCYEEVEVEEKFVDGRPELGGNIEYYI